MPTICGVENEYPLILIAREPQEAPTRGEMYEILEGLVQRKYLTLPAAMIKGGRFLENGGLILYEAQVSRPTGGLVELATPECRTPVDAATYQHSMDQLLLDLSPDLAAAVGGDEGPAHLFFGKNTTDGKGNYYGYHENFEVRDPLPTSGRLLLPLVLLPMWLLYGGLRFLSLLLLFLMLITLLLSVFAYALCLELLSLGRLLPRIGPWCGGLLERLGRFNKRLLKQLTSADNPFDRVYLAFCLRIFRPWYGLYSRLIEPFLLRPYKAHLTSHLVSRIVFTGTGQLLVTEAGVRYGLSQRAPAIRCLARIFFDSPDRPIYDIKSFVRQPTSIFDDSKRLHITMAEAAMCGTQTLLSLSTTWLVCEMIEAGERFEALRLADPVAALHAFGADSALSATSALRTGEQLTALQLQRGYLDAAKRFFQQDTREWVRASLRSWERVLTTLEISPSLLYDELDWVAKRDLMLEHLRRDKLSLSTLEPTHPRCDDLRLIDLRYHELSESGYHRRLLRGGLLKRTFEDERLIHCLTNPPSGTRATIRSRLIKRFAGQDPQPGLSWESIVWPGRFPFSRKEPLSG